MRYVRTWEVHWLAVAQEVAQRSKDPSTQVGAVIVDEENTVVITGHNGMPQGVPEYSEMWERPVKYDYVLHAELNAIARAARGGRSVKGCTLYVTHFPCNDCAKAIVASGIKRVIVAGDQTLSPRWDIHLEKASRLFSMSQVEVQIITV